VPRCRPRGVARSSFFSSLLHSKREKRRADRWRSARTSAPHRHARRQNDLQLDAQRPYHLRKPHVTPRFSSTRAPMPLQNVGGFRASPENLLERLWAFSHRSLRRKKGMYLVHIHAKKHEKCENLELGFWVCCEKSGVFSAHSRFSPPLFCAALGFAGWPKKSGAKVFSRDHGGRAPSPHTLDAIAARQNPAQSRTDGLRGPCFAVEPRFFAHLSCTRRQSLAQSLGQKSGF